MRFSHLLPAAVVAACAAVAAAEEEEPPVSPFNLGIGIMLLGSIGFMMGLFYLVNHSDVDIKMYSWRVICSTISIFTAVLIFQAVDAVLKQYIFAEVFEAAPIATNFCISLAWFIALQIFLMIASRAVKVRCVKPLPKEGAEREEMAEKIELDMRCWAVLLGHITGFSSICAWCSLQQQFKDDIVSATVMIPVSAVALWLLYTLLNAIREYFIGEDEGKPDKQKELWDEGTEETEDDVFGLTVSFLMVQCIRFSVHGSLPNHEGNYPDGTELPGSQMITVAAVGILFAIAIFARGILVKATLGRISDWSRLVCNFVFSWCIMFSIDEYLETAGVGGEEGGCMGKVVLAMVITVLSFALIFALDTLADLESTSAKVDKSIRSLVGALGILIGFSWEDCFDVAVANVASKVHFMPDVLTKLALSLLLGAMVVPAWRWYILPVVSKMEEEWDALRNGSGPIPETVDVEAEAYKPLAGGEASRGNDKNAAEVLARELAAARMQLQASEERANRAESALNTGGSAGIVSELRQKLLDANASMEQLRSEKPAKEVLAAYESRGQEIAMLKQALRSVEESAALQAERNRELQAALKTAQENAGSPARIQANALSPTPSARSARSVGGFTPQVSGGLPPGVTTIAGIGPTLSAGQLLSGPPGAAAYGAPAPAAIRTTAAVPTTIQQVGQPLRIGQGSRQGSFTAAPPVYMQAPAVQTVQPQRRQ